MARIFELPPRPANVHPWQNHEIITETIAVITPIFGAGYEPGVPDTVTPINAKSIRGHLRFWWRATRGMGYSTVQELRKRENEIWGSAEEPSFVDVSATAPQPPTIQDCGTYLQRVRKTNGGVVAQSLEYVLFPFKGIPGRGGAPAEPPKSMIAPPFHFHLTIRWPKPEKLKNLREALNKSRFPREPEKWPPPNPADDIRKDIEAAVWAWTNFGGIGARTRRGCGALFCKKYAPANAEAIGPWMTNHWQHFDLGTEHVSRDWTTLNDWLHIKDTSLVPLMAWARAVAPFRAFRQGPGVGRSNGQGGHPGPSRWPEPEVIRRITKTRARRHARLPEVPDDGFPRARFGLPIIYHFVPNQGEPQDTELFPEDIKVINGQKSFVARSRMASPIILKPLAFSEEYAVAAVVALNARTPARIGLRNLVTGHKYNLDPQATEPSLMMDPGPRAIIGARFGTYPGSPMFQRSDSGDALDAFLTYLEEQPLTFVCKPDLDIS